MSQESVDRLLEATELFNRIAETPGSPDLNAAAGLFQLFHPQIRFEPKQAMLEGSYEGPEGVGQWLADLMEHYAGGRMDYTDVRDLGDRVLALGTLRVIGRGSGIEIDVPLALVATTREGLIDYMKDYGDHAAALEAVGLAE